MQTEIKNFGANRVSRTFKPNVGSSIGHLTMDLDFFDHGLPPMLTVSVDPEAVDRCGGLSKVYLRDAVSDGRTVASALHELAAGFLVLKLGVSLRPVGSSPDPNRLVYAIDARGRSFVDFSRALAPRSEEGENHLAKLFYV
jgi:hypothetical protein